MTWHAQEVRSTFTIVDTVGGESITVAIAKTPVCSVLMPLLQFAWRMEDLTMVALKFITMGNGAQCVMTAGILLKRMWCVAILASLAHHLQFNKPHLARDLVVSGWMMSTFRERILIYGPVLMLAGKTAITARMQVLFAALIR